MFARGCGDGRRLRCCGEPRAAVTHQPPPHDSSSSSSSSLHCCRAPGHHPRTAPAPSLSSPSSPCPFPSWLAAEVRSAGQQTAERSADFRLGQQHVRTSRGYTGNLQDLVDTQIKVSLVLQRSATFDFGQLGQKRTVCGLNSLILALYPSVLIHPFDQLRAQGDLGLAVGQH